MIQDIYPNIYHNAYEAKQIESEDFIILFKGDQVYIREENEQISYVKYKQWLHMVCPEERMGNKEVFRFAFSIDHVSYFVNVLDVEIPQNCHH